LQASLFEIETTTVSKREWMNLKYVVKMKEIETAAIGCVIGVCALVSGGCKFVRSILSKLSQLCGNGTERGEQREAQDASESLVA
jgi:hypothetical protein